VEIHDQGTSTITSAGDPAIGRLLRSMAYSSDRYLILGVRPQGFDDFEWLRDQAERDGVTVGYVPLDEGWRIRAPGGKLL